MILKVFSLVHFLSILLWKEQMITSVRKMLKTLVCSAQNRSFSSEICLENNPKIGHFFTDCLLWSLPWNFPWNWPIFPRICPQKSRKIWLFSIWPIRSPDELCEIPSRLADPVLGRPLGMSLSWISKPIASCIEGKTMSLSVFYYSVGTFLCCCAVSTYLWSLILSPFLLSFVAVSRPCDLLKFCPNRVLYIYHLETCLTLKRWHAHASDELQWRVWKPPFFTLK